MSPASFKSEADSDVLVSTSSPLPAHDDDTAIQNSAVPLTAPATCLDSPSDSILGFSDTSSSTNFSEDGHFATRRANGSCVADETQLKIFRTTTPLKTLVLLLRPLWPPPCKRPCLRLSRLFTSSLFDSWRWRANWAVCTPNPASAAAASMPQQPGTVVADGCSCVGVYGLCLCGFLERAIKRARKLPPPMNGACAFATLGGRPLLH